ncbi:UDP-2,3-diacylglucosamine diphosphatase LpxI [Mesorhizobium sp. BAC0120]|uniref:LpxI family protein n=1 Tax=Mesorhizobium sp. BAC0120 TaxID=3090670 RepID=UPI00298C0BD7|nr:UDP-2,3-diacylglucosamine diphosphatase LpxI [Mesorhizobium sp. BAC0120]MDW6022824.1 UDP-2,3-diacylglucosamine diphosphatase LpxI [Mesorhizobium sp. BAC0120]
MATKTPMPPPETRPAIELAASDRVAVIAGSGRLPVNVAAGLNAAGHPPFVVITNGEEADVDELTSYDHATIELEHMADLIPLLKRERITHVVLAGGIGRRPRLTRLKPSRYMLTTMLPRLALALGKGDNALLSTIVALIEEVGPKVVGAHEVVPDLLAIEGAITRAQPKSADYRDLRAAFSAAKAIGALDIGQGAIAIGGRVIAVEGVEGTDGLLARTASLRSHPRLSGKKRGVIVKCAKPGQELRADLPAIGPQTVKAAHDAGLAGIGVEAGHSLILDYETVRSSADALGLFVVGLPGDTA